MGRGGAPRDTVVDDRHLQFRVLGPVEVVAEDGPISLGGPKQRAVLAHLLIRANELVSAETLIDEIWGDQPPAKARNTLQSYVSHLRAALGEGRIEGRTPGYLLRLDPSELDVARFDLLTRDATRALPKDPGVAATLLDEALQLWHGPALSDVIDGTSLLAEAARLDELKVVAVEERISALMALGEQARVIGELEGLVGRHPLRERIWALLMLALYRDGRQADALNVFQRVREILEDELGVDPSPELARLHERILQHDPSLDLRGQPLRGYRLLEKLDDGPIGTVFRAIQPQVGRDVVVKVVHERIASDPSFVRRFNREAQVIAGLEHPRIVPVYDYWREPVGAYVVSRFLRGGTLRAMLERGEIFDVDRAVAILEQIASALAFAHRQDVAHGNVKPSNILLDAEGNAYLADFRIGVGEDAEPAMDIHELVAIARAMLPTEPPAALGELIRRDESGDVLDAEEFLTGVRHGTEPETIEVSPAGEARNPYKGLRPFLESDAVDFFGRNQMIERLLARLTEPVRGARFLAVVGPSGSGKSSVVRAGLVPAIRHGKLYGTSAPFIVEMAPGSHPLEELEAALMRVTVGSGAGLRERLEAGSRGLLDAVALAMPAGTGAVLVVDQFEEIFTLARVEHERELFLEQLRVATVDPESPLHVVVTLRADFFDRPLVYPRFGELLAARTEAVPALTPDELEQAISGPAEKVGVHPEPGLVARMIADVANQPGALPLVQYALTELFERRDGDRMTTTAYQEIGGVAGALSARAERIFEQTEPASRHAIRQVFLRLVTLGEGRQDTRRRVARSELDSLEVSLDSIDAVLDAYGRHRLLTFDREPSTREPTVEIAHEALLGAWTRLRRWIDTTREDLRQERAIARASAEWRGSDRDPSFLLGGIRLQQAEVWATGTGLAIGSTEREFLKASVDFRESEQAVERERGNREARLERRSRSRLRVSVGVLTVATLVASTLTVIAVSQRREAAQQSRVAFARELAAASVANVDVDSQRSILLALEAIGTTREHDGTVLQEAEEALHRAVVASRIVRSFPSEGDMLDWSPDGSLFVTEGADESGLIDIRDAATGEAATPPFRAHDPDVNGVVFSDDGSMLATTGDDGDVRVWDPRTGEELWGYDGKPGTVWTPSFSPDGSLLAAPFDEEEMVRIWDLSTGTLVHEIDTRDVGFTTAFSPDGGRLAFTTWGSPAIVIDVGSGEEVMRMQHGDVREVAWSPDGRWIATSGYDGTVRLWDGGTGAAKFALYGHRSEVVNVDWSPDSSRLVTGSTDLTAKVWEIRPDGGKELLSISAESEGFGNWFWPVFSPDGTQVMTGAAAARAVTIWDVGFSADAEWVNLPTYDFDPGVAFTSDGGGVIASNGDGSVTVWDAERGRAVGSIGRPGSKMGPVSDPDPWSPVIAIDVSHDGLIAAARGQGDLVVWEESTGDETFDLPASLGWYPDVAWSDDGTLLAAARVDGATTIVDRTGQEVALVNEEDKGFFVNAVSFSPDGQLLATARESDDRPNPRSARVSIWDWRREEVVQTMQVWARDVAFDPTGTRVATGSLLGVGHIWDVESGSKLATLSGSSGGVTSIEFSPDGTVVATAGTDGTVRLWDPQTGAQLLALRGHDRDVWNLAFSPDGSKLASSSLDGVVRVWSLDLDDLIGIADRELTRGFTEAECRQYLHVDACPAIGRV